MAAKKNALGRGLGALIDTSEGTERELVHSPAAVNEIPVKSIDVNPFQPRTSFDEESLNELVQSVEEHGIIQPITVRRAKDNRYELISGERRLRAAVKHLQPRLLVLDPLVRIARLDENSAADVSQLLGHLRAMQRDFDLAVLLVHHARKSRAQNPGQALRGSSDISAWSDTNLYLSRKNQHLTLQVEHRFAAPPPPLQLQLSTDPAVHLSILNYLSPIASETNDPNQNLDPLQQQLLQLLSLHRPLTSVALRSLLHRRKQLVVAALNRLQELNLVERTPEGWRLPT